MSPDANRAWIDVANFLRFEGLHSAANLVLRELEKRESDKPLGNQWQCSHCNASNPFYGQFGNVVNGCRQCGRKKECKACEAEQACRAAPGCMSGHTCGTRFPYVYLPKREGP